MRQLLLVVALGWPLVTGCSLDPHASSDALATDASRERVSAQDGPAHGAARGAAQAPEGTAAAAARGHAAETAGAASSTRALTSLRPLGLRWTGGDGLGVADEDRFAVVVGADRYRRADWDLPFVSANVDAMTALFAGPASVPPDRLSVLRGERVHATAVQEAILRAGEQASTPDALLLLYLTGHGWVDRRGSPGLFTYYTREDGAGGYEQLITRDDLDGWAARASLRAAERGSALSVLVLFDACRVGALAPSRDAELQPLRTWELYGTRDGRFAAAPVGDQPSPFTAALVEVVAALSRTAGAAPERPLDRLFEEVRRRTQVATGGAQEPQLIVGGALDRQPDLLGPRRVPIAVRVVDVAEQLAVPGARVEIDGQLAPVEAGLARSTVATGDHLLRVTADGFLVRSEAVRVDASARGRVLELELRPRVTLVRGFLSPPGVRELKVVGLTDPGRRGFHRTSTTSAADGSFELRLPYLAEGLELLVPDGPEPALRYPLPLRPDRVLRDSSAGGDGVGLVELGTLLLQEGAGSAVWALASRPLEPGDQGLLLPLPEDLFDPRAPQLDGRLDRNDFGQALELLDAGLLERAAERLALLAARTGDADVARWLMRVEFERLLSLHDAQAVERSIAHLPRVAEPASGPLHALALSWRLADARGLAGQADLAALDVLVVPMPAGVLAGRTQDDRRLRNAARDLRLSTAATLVSRVREQRRWADLLTIFERLGAAPGWGGRDWNAIRREVGTEALSALLDRGTDRGVARGDWADALLAAAFVERHSREDWSHLDEALAAFRREHVSLAVREAFAAAGRALERGEFEQALALDGQALAGSNAHYRELISARMSGTREQLYVRRSREALDAELAGDSEGAIAGWLAALALDDRAARELRRFRGELINVPAGDGVALQRALADAAPMSVLRVPAGTYEVALRVERPLVIEAQGGEVVVSPPSGPALTLASPLALVQGLLLRSTSGPALVLEPGRAELSDCTVLDGGVQADGAGVRLELSACVLWSGPRPALTVGGGAEVRLAGGILRGVGISGAAPTLHVRDGGHVVAQELSLMNAHAGVRIDGGGQLELRKGVLSDHSTHGLEVRSGGRLAMHGTLVHDNGGMGLMVRAGGSADVTECNFRANLVGSLDWEA
ncbi:MAG: hypothetical protein DRQ55_14225, partial [Planctomycetota bacterium]